jgi:hypothetical protein
MARAFDQAAADRILEAMGNGTSLKDAAADENVSLWQWWEWCDENPTLAKRYSSARARLAECMVNDMPHIAENEADPQRARVKIEARRWVASKWKADTYGDRVDVNVTGQVDLVAAIGEARERALRLGCDQTPVIEAEYVEIKGQIGNGAADRESVSTDDEVDIFS